MSSPVYYDLSELYLLSRGRLKFYGIARVVAEIGYELHLLDKGVVFVVYDETARDFFEVKPHFGKASYNGVVDLGFPEGAIPFRLRGPKAGRSLPNRMFATTFSAFLRAVNRSKLRALRSHLKPIALNDGYLVSAGRPKLLVDMIDCLVRTRSKTRFYPLLHDCIPLHDFGDKPDAFQLNFHADNNKVIRHASHIIANSQFTARDLQAKVKEGLLPPLPGVSVVPLAHECRADGEKPKLELPARPYVLGVGITLGRKNLDVVLAAQRLLVEQGKTPPLMVIAGANRRRTVAGLKSGLNAMVAPHVLMVDSPSQADLIRLYQNALATLMPSKLEGWGLPLGESLWLGTPALASPSSSLPEVGGDLAVYFDPDSPGELAGLLERLATDQDYRRSLQQRIAEARPSLRSWRHVAEDMLAAIQSPDCQPMHVAG
ncbi:glycosyltransferase family 4 protein [Aminobacter niigataensis]|uniref:Glycosyltransferase involved in cell wall biosynthesis n=1 Tax=Aminobacter niigataensis TaxID=83265 RepID=A0ABR6KXB2_9HYPH|nr:glycosyltransferase family 1 protein [Aminobacter niigataensis]MBB4648465.1 glycosyltransferase involved in cell wall biosynthesis [Aminobacter niigataensis]CAI2933725.1 Glycosyltransferase, family [Aminobacter niigataensis]